MRRSDYDYALAALVAAIATYLGHRWARYVGENWPSFVETVGRGLEGAALLAALPDNPFYLKGMSAKEVIDLANTIREAVQRNYLDLVLDGEVINFLTKRTYFGDEIQGIDSPGISRIRYGHTWSHTTGTGRGRFELESAPGRLSFGFRVVRGGDFKGLTAVEVVIELVSGGVTARHAVADIAEERHVEFAQDVLLGVSGELLRSWYSTEEAKLIASEMASLALAIGGFGEA